MEDFQQLVYTRLQTLPKGYTISVGGAGNITKDQALEHVNKNDDIGKLLIAADRHYFNLIKTGELYAGITD